jgi:hypothetical protein
MYPTTYQSKFRKTQNSLRICVRNTYNLAKQVERIDKNITTIMGNTQGAVTAPTTGVWCGWVGSPILALPSPHIPRATFPPAPSPATPPVAL